MKFSWRTRNYFIVLVIVLYSSTTAAVADDGRGLQRGGDPKQVSISGLSSGAAMAVQYAVAHSGSVTAVGAIAGPQWGCAGGSLSRAVNVCMCGRGEIASTMTLARELDGKGLIDKLVSGKPRSLSRAWVFQSPADATVASKSGIADADFLKSLIGSAPEIDQGNHADGSDQAGHGIITPGGSDACTVSADVEAEAERKETFVRACGREDNVGKMFHALFGAGDPYDPSKRAPPIPASEVWTFDQQHVIDRVRAGRPSVTNDKLFLDWWPPQTSARRSNFDMAPTGYVYVPPACRVAGSACSVHVALHGCKQDARQYASTAGYNEWAERYHAIIVYPAIAPGKPLSGAVCQPPGIYSWTDLSWAEPNPNGCWDWWGYLDTSSNENRYLTKQAPQMQVIEGIVSEVTAPAAR